MKKISSVSIENFQSHKNTYIEFSDFTSIVGPSNSGKTAIVRAIKWALFNTPSGTSFITRGQPSCKVTVTFNDNTSVTRIRGESENKYILKTDTDIQELEHFGMGSVDSVVDFHGIYELDLFGEKEPISVCGQLDRPFFISESDVTKAAMIGKLAGTDKIDYAIKEASSDVRSERKKRRELNEDLKSIKKELKELSSLEKKKEKLEKGQSILDKIKLSHEKALMISNISDKKRAAVQALKVCELLLSQEEQILEMGNLLSILEEAYQKCNSTKTFFDMLESTKIQLKESEKILSDNKVLSVEDTLNTLFEELEKDIPIAEKCSSLLLSLDKSKKQLEQEQKLFEEDRLDKMRYLRANLPTLETEVKDFQNKQDVVSELDFKKSILDDAISEISKKDEDLKYFKSEYKSFLVESEVCPTCFGKISGDKADKIIEESE